MKVKRRALADRREIVGHTQETLAEFVGVQPTTVGRWERGETSPQPWSRPKLAGALAISVEQLNTMLAEGQPVEQRQPVAGGSRNPHAATSPSTITSTTQCSSPLEPSRYRRSGNCADGW